MYTYLTYPTNIHVFFLFFFVYSGYINPFSIQHPILKYGKKSTEKKVREKKYGGKKGTGKNSTGKKIQGGGEYGKKIRGKKYRKKVRGKKVREKNTGEKVRGKVT